MMPNAMNLSSERKQSMKSLLTVISLALAVVSPAFASIEWNFPVSDNPIGASVGSGTATITLGSYGTGWHGISTAPWSSYGSVPGASGLWDLGQAGSIVLSGLSGSGLTTLNVFQWVQPGGVQSPTSLDPYNGYLGYTLGGTASGSGVFSILQQMTGGSGAGWWDYAANLGAIIPGETITIQASAGGAIIDRLTLVPEPATLIAGAVLLIPFAFSTWPILRRRGK